MSLQCITPTIGLVAGQTPDHFVSVCIVSLPSYGCHSSYDHWIIVTTTTTTDTTIFDDLMTKAKCDQRIADLFTKGSHHRNISIVYLTQNIFPQGRACKDIALNTQYLVLFNNPIDRQQVATLARRFIRPLAPHL